MPLTKVSSFLCQFSWNLKMLNSMFIHLSPKLKNVESTGVNFIYALWKVWLSLYWFPQNS
jgi:hypothetical protein